MAGFAESTVASAAIALLAPLPTRSSPALPAGEQLPQANLYAVSELVAGRAARASSARQYGSITRAFATRCATSSVARPSSPT